MNSMKKITVLLAVLMTAGALLAFPSCSKGGKNDETTTGTAPVITAPDRYDYIDAVVAPDVTIDRATYTDMKLTLPASLQVKDKDVDRYVEGLLFRYRTAEHGTDKMDAEPMKMGDSAFIYYKGYLDGKAFEGGSNWEDKKPFELGLGSHSFIPGFEEGLVGVIPKETSREKPAEVQVTFPKDYNNKDLAGKNVIFYVYVEYAVQYTIPAYNREFVEKTLKYEPKEDFYASDRALLDEFEAYVRKTMEDGNRQYVENAKSDALWKYLTDNAECRNLPQKELDFYMKSYTDEVQYSYDNYKAQGGGEFIKRYPTLDSFAIVYYGLEEGDNWKEKMQERAENMVCKSMILHAIAENEGLETVTEEEYKAEVKYWVDYYQGYMKEEEIIQNMGEVFLRESAFSAKMEKWLLDRCTFTFEADPDAETETETDTETTAPAETTAPETTAAETTVAETTAG